MSGVQRSLAKLDPWTQLGVSPSNSIRQIADPSSVARENVGGGKKPATVGSLLDPGGWFDKPKPPPSPIAAPNQDTAANAAQTQQDAMRRRRGVLANIFAGDGSSAATVGTKTLLGT